MCSSQLKISASETILIEITSETIQEFDFPKNLSKLEEGNIIAIQAYHSGDFPKTRSGRTVVPIAVLQAGFMTLEGKNGKQLICDVPLQDLRRANNQGVYEQLAPVQIDFSKSKINIGDVTVLAGMQNRVIPIRVIYIPKGNC